MSAEEVLADGQFYLCHACQNSNVRTSLNDGELVCQSCGAEGFVEKVEDADALNEFRANGNQAAGTAGNAGNAGNANDAGNAGTAGNRGNTGGAGNTGNPVNAYDSWMREFIRMRGAGNRTGGFTFTAGNIPGNQNNVFMEEIDGESGVAAQRMVDAVTSFMNHYASAHGGTHLFSLGNGSVGVTHAQTPNFPLPHFESMMGRMNRFHVGDYALGEGGLHAAIRHISQNDPNNYGNPPAAAEAVRALPELTINEALKVRHEECVVCEEGFEIGQKCLQMPCGHVYCRDCLVPWLERHNTCPTCRFELRTDDPEYERRRATEQARMHARGSH